MSWLLDVFRVLSSCGAGVLILSLVPATLEIFKNKTTGPLPFSPLVAMLINSHLWVLYGYLTENFFPLLATFAFGDVVSVFYIIVYYRFCGDRVYTNRIFGAGMLIIAATTAYTVLGVLAYTHQSRSSVADVMGYLSNAASLFLSLSPFEKIRLVIKHKSAAFIPIHLVVVRTVNGLMWAVYSLLLDDWFLFGPSAFTLVVGIIQIAYYVVYHPSSHPLPVQFAAVESPIRVGVDEELKVVYSEHAK